MKVRVRITCSGPAPASRSAARMIARTRRAWISGSGSQEPSGQIGAVPDTSTRVPLRTALLNPICGSYGDPEEIRCRSVAIPSVCAILLCLRQAQHAITVALLDHELPPGQKIVHGAFDRRFREVRQ